MEGGHTLGNSLAGDAQHPRGCRCTQGIHGIVSAHNPHIYMAVSFPVDSHVKMAPIRRNIDGTYLVLLPQAKADVGNALHGFHRVGVVSVGGNAEGCHFRKLMEGFLDVCQILEIVQMICLHIQHHR